MNIQKCVGCGQELWWHGDNPPICKTCHSDPAPLIAQWKAEALAAREWIEVLTKLAYSRDTDTYINGRVAYLAAIVKDAQP